MSKKVTQVKKTTKTASVTGDRRSASNGPVQNVKAEAQKKSAHNRMKSNSYRQSNKDNSFMGATAASNNDPSVEG